MLFKYQPTFSFDLNNASLGNGFELYRSALLMRKMFSFLLISLKRKCALIEQFYLAIGNRKKMVFDRKYYFRLFRLDYRQTLKLNTTKRF